jgi:hypothetical protein
MLGITTGNELAELLQKVHEMATSDVNASKKPSFTEAEKSKLTSKINTTLASLTDVMNAYKAAVNDKDKVKEGQELWRELSRLRTVVEKDIADITQKDIQDIKNIGTMIAKANNFMNGVIIATKQNSSADPDAASQNAEADRNAGSGSGTSEPKTEKTEKMFSGSSTFSVEELKKYVRERNKVAITVIEGLTGAKARQKDLNELIQEEYAIMQNQGHAIPMLQEENISNIVANYLDNKYCKG